MQLLFDESEEMGRHAGLSIIPGRVLRFPGDMRGAGGRPLKVPHIGWNQLAQARTDDPLLAGVPDLAYAYFVHSYYCAPQTLDCVLTLTAYGIEFASVVRRGKVWGIQCHPEKSQDIGLRILRNFVGIVTGLPPSDESEPVPGAGASTGSDR
jgi:glutamine amidotransferase